MTRVAISQDELQLLIREEDVADPELSTLIPALNEEWTIGEFVPGVWRASPAQVFEERS